ncbi:trimeric intracellular cation channel family protein [Segatella salivae]|jgi:protein Yads|uniref:trimeric intracellular cation channel family protein n=1 Tax=Segatella salivae TaxID=228604 RepID=UPI001CB1A565|nr:trimeric intracellular cation channel family protein [Segatella salivae]MBF1524611.1 trimeric intracellular cation channel family protein [Segatella salivae]MBF1530103.1 trimeric intracellular cation channel family protein [Segatella salivae]MBF1539745.1 trimeric intracellular cation channel family protein [Segatella salivae]MBF1545088.1 trimeric intracellular cation channel family protein [Segatella salivae]MBF1567397.1 trimeric intracellular cation channel family protein [Segatella saliva
MIAPNPQVAHTVLLIIEFIGTFAFAISGIRMAAAKHFDWFGGFVCGFAVAIGGGTIRDVMLGVTPFWMTSSIYFTCTIIALLVGILFSKKLSRMENAWLITDTLGLAMFTIAGLQKTLQYGHPFWVAIVMGCITGVAGGVIRDVLLNQEPIIFQKDIYAMASVAGGLIYWLLAALGINIGITSIVTFFVICLVRYVAVRYHISLPLLRGENDE